MALQRLDWNPVEAHRARTRAFMDAPDSARVGEEAGVMDGDYHWVEQPRDD